ncbi:MAG: amidohydrolase family protein [Ardenticatenaceae bacterium]|nr:amidohydrolase family protein [Ardenticatenaceae bacterium]HBY92749.1 hypothetical protein [Chloroflexota bacterium]
MASKVYDLLLSRGRIIDPLNQRDGVADLGIVGGKVVEVGEELPVDRAAQTVAVDGRLVLPGLIDPHVHLSYWFGCQAGYRMLARAGITTAVDAAGPPDEIIRGLRERGAGINVATHNVVWPGRFVPSTDPSKSDIDRFIENSLRGGAIALKLLGGHFPLTAEATARVIEQAASAGVFVTFHVGTTRTPGDLNGFFEAVELAGGRRLHVAHMNAYCRGQLSGEPLADAVQALDVLQRSPNITSDSYVFSRNGTPALCTDGVPVSRVTRNWLVEGGYEATESGLTQAILDGFAWVIAERDSENVFVQGEEGYAAWREAGTDTGVSFEANPYTSMIPLAIAKDSKGDFIVTALCTDGGGIPRNALVEKGLGLVRLGALTIQEFVQKASIAPAHLYGFNDKGHLGPGADADVTVLDPLHGVATHTIVEGRIVMEGGRVLGRGGTLLVTTAGVKEARAGGVEYQVIA